MSNGHTNECRWWKTGNINDCDCKPKEKEPPGRWAKEPFLRLDSKGKVIYVSQER